MQHVDEIDDDDPTDVPKTKLFGHLFCGIEIRVQHRLFQIGLAYEASGIHIDDGQGFCPIYDDVSPRLQPDATINSFPDLFNDVMLLEQWERAGVPLDTIRQVRSYLIEIILDLLVHRSSVDDDFLDVTGEKVTDDPDRKIWF